MVSSHWIMNKTDSHKLLQVIRHLYEVEQLSLKKISDRLGITRQAIHGRMVRSGIKLRPNVMPLKKFDRDVLHQLYEVERRPVYKVAEAMGVSHCVVERELKRHGIERRPKHSEKRRPSVLDGLAIGDSIVLKRPKLPKPHARLYMKAKDRRMKISIRRIDDEHIRVTRID